MKHKRLTSLFGLTYLLASLINPLFGQKIEPVHQVKWMTIAEAKVQRKVNPKPVLVFFYTPGNDTSEMMLEKVFSRKEVISYLNGKFYAVKFDVKSNEKVDFFDDKHYERQEGKTFHNIAAALLGENVQLPSMLFYTDTGSGFIFKGFRSHFDILSILVYFGENVEKTTPYRVWAPAYFRTYPPNQPESRISMAINWLKLEDALKLNKEKPKGIFLTWYVKYNASSAIMLVNTFTHKKVAAFMNENFYCVRLDAHSTDTLLWDKKYVNSKDGKTNYHELAEYLMKGDMQFPSIFFFDKENHLLLAENLYISPEAFFIIANYIKSESFKTMPLADYLKTFKFDWEDIAPREFINQPADEQKK